MGRQWPEARNHPVDWHCGDLTGFLWTVPLASGSLAFSIDSRAQGLGERPLLESVVGDGGAGGREGDQALLGASPSPMNPRVLLAQA